LKTDDESVFRDTDWLGSSHDEDPPDSNLGPAADERLEEDEIWNFPITSFTNKMIVNEWFNPDVTKAEYKSYIPWWHEKLFTPDFFREDSWKKMEF